MGEGPVRLHPHPEGAEHVRAVGIIGDLAEALRLALGAEAAAGHVEALQRRIAFGIDLHLGGEDEVIGDPAQGQVLVRPGQPLHGHGHVIDGHRHHLQPHPVQHQRRIGLAGAGHGQPGPDPGGVGREGDVQLDAVDAEGKGPVVGQLDRGDGVCAHGGECSSADTPTPPGCNSCATSKSASQNGRSTPFEKAASSGGGASHRIGGRRARSRNVI